jgi:Carbohydrate binding domain
MQRLLTAAFIVFVPIVGFADDAKNLLKPVNKTESWRFEKAQGGEGEFKIADDAAVFKVTKTTGTDWHVQAFQVDLDLKEGQDYTVKVKLRAGESRSVSLVAMIDKDDWHEIGLHEQLNLTKNNQSFEFSFKARGVAEKKNRIGLALGEEKGEVIVQEMSLTEKKP